MNNEVLFSNYLPLSVLLVANIWLFVLNYKWHKFLKEEMSSLAKKIDQGMAGILELDA